MKTSSEYIFSEPSPWKPARTHLLAGNEKLQICGIECECLGIFSENHTVTIDLYSEWSPEDFLIFFVEKSEINGTPCQFLDGRQYRPDETSRRREDIEALCQGYGKEMESGRWLHRILLAHPTGALVEALYLVLKAAWKRLEPSVPVLCTKLHYTKEGFRTRDFSAHEGICPVPFQVEQSPLPRKPEN